jgi:hypothetical protein
MALTRRRWFYGLILVAISCERDEAPRPDPIADCNEPECTVNGNGSPFVPIGVMSPGGGGASGGGGAAGAAGGGGLPPPGVGTLAGSVRAVVEPDLSASRNLDQILEVHAAGANEDEVVAETTASGTFRLEGVQPIPLLWVGVGPFDDSLTGTFMNTLQPVDASVASNLELLVARRSVMDQVAQTFMSNPELDPDAGHIIVRFVNESGIGVGGVSITFPEPEPVAIGYDAGDIYSDQTLETATRGTVVLLNLPAAAYPGGLTSVVAESSLEPIDLNFRVASGSVTIATVQVDP